MHVTADSEIGKTRNSNEDYIGYFKNKQGALIAILADGVGGNVGGDVAASMTVDFIGENFQNYHISSINETKLWLSNIIKQANENILSYGKTNEKFSKMATTVVIAIFFGNQYLLTHLGDSRCYLYRNNTLQQLTEDHSYVNYLIDKGKIKSSDDVDANMRNVIVKGLGVSEDADVDISNNALLPDDVVMVCSDGLTKMVDDTNIQNVFQKNISDDSKVNALMDLANENGGKDNISVLIINNRLGSDRL